MFCSHYGNAENQYCCFILIVGVPICLSLLFAFVLTNLFLLYLFVVASIHDYLFLILTWFGECSHAFAGT